MIARITGMSKLSKRTGAATIVAVSFGVLLLTSGCATKRDIDKVLSRIDRVEAQQSQTPELMAKLDSLLSQNIEANDKLSTDLRITASELSASMEQLLANYNDLMNRIEELSKNQPEVIERTITSSPGATPGGPSVSPTGKTEGECTLMYDDAFILVRRGQYDSAIDSFRVFLSDCPQHVNVENAHYWIGESYYSTERYIEAITEYEIILEQFPNSPQISRTLYKLGRARQEMGNNSEAREVFDRLIKEYPNTFEADQAKERLKEMS